ncbi:MAG: SIS domain-containing protein [bacterium]|nr:SIS domain-containing protein [bacterium]
MSTNSDNRTADFADYSRRLQAVLAAENWDSTAALADAMFEAWVNRKRVYLCGNGGSAGNAIHLANDFLYGVAKDLGPGMRIQALPANGAVMTCLANDISYDEVFAAQLEVLGEEGDVLVVLSGSGNSPNVVRALEVGNKLGLRTFAILGYSGGRCKELAETPLHFAVDDMQISEDLQLVVGHMLMQTLYKRIKAHVESPAAASS